MKKTKSLLSTLFFVLLAATATAVAQDQGAEFQGQVTGPFDGLVGDAPMRAVHIASGDSWQTRTDADGKYKFDGLPAGDYRLQVRLPCCEYAPYQSEPVELGSGAERHI